MSAFRPSFCLNGSFEGVFKIFCHRQTHGPITLYTPVQVWGNNDCTYIHFQIHKLWKGKSNQNKLLRRIQLLRHMVDLCDLCGPAEKHNYSRQVPA